MNPGQLFAQALRSIVDGTLDDLRRGLFLAAVGKMKARAPKAAGPIADGIIRDDLIHGDTSGMDFAEILATMRAAGLRDVQTAAQRLDVHRADAQAAIDAGAAGNRRGYAAAAVRHFHAARIALERSDAESAVAETIRAFEALWLAEVRGIEPEIMVGMPVKRGRRDGGKQTAKLRKEANKTRDDLLVARLHKLVTDRHVTPRDAPKYLVDHNRAEGLSLDRLQRIWRKVGVR